MLIHHITTYTNYTTAGSRHTSTGSMSKCLILVKQRNYVFQQNKYIPVNEGRIQENINNQKTDLSNPNDWSCQDSLDLIT